MGNGFCMGLISSFRRTPPAMVFDMADDGLTALMHVDVLDGDLLFACFPSVSAERFHLCRVGAE